MSEDMTNVPRRLRRFYRHGEPVPHEMETDAGKSAPRNTNPIPLGENHDENEPWMNAPRATTANEANPSRRNARRENARTPIATNAQPSEPKPGLFSRVLHGGTKTPVTPIDHALGLHEKNQFLDKTPHASDQAMRQTPPSFTGTPTAPKAQADIQKALQELRALAKNDGASATSKTPVPASSFHFTPAGEAPRAPESEEKPASTAPAGLSPRERAEQRRQGRTTPTESPTPNTPSSRPPATPEKGMPAHIRRRMGQLIDEERMDRDETPASRDAPADEKEDEDFKSLFSENKSKDKDKKKKKAGEDDDDMSMGDDEELELFEDDK